MAISAAGTPASRSPFSHCARSPAETASDTSRSAAHSPNAAPPNLRSCDPAANDSRSSRAHF